MLKIFMLLKTAESLSDTAEPPNIFVVYVYYVDIDNEPYLLLRYCGIRDFDDVYGQ